MSHDQRSNPPTREGEDPANEINPPLGHLNYGYGIAAAPRHDAYNTSYEERYFAPTSGSFEPPSTHASVAASLHHPNQSSHDRAAYGDPLDSLWEPEELMDWEFTDTTPAPLSFEAHHLQGLGHQSWVYDPYSGHTRSASHQSPPILSLTEFDQHGSYPSGNSTGVGKDTESALEAALRYEPSRGILTPNVYESQFRQPWSSWNLTGSEGLTAANLSMLELPQDSDLSVSSRRSVSTYHNASSASAVSSSIHGQCPTCGQLFSGKYRKGNLGRHIRLKHHGSGPHYPCQDDYCSKVFFRQDARLKHYRRHHPYLQSPPELRLIRPSDRDLGLGETWVEEDYETKGPIAVSAEQETEVARTTSLSEPRTDPNCKDEDTIQCEICQTTFRRAAELRRHMLSKHDPDPPKYTCDVPGCSVVFLRKDKLFDHRRNVHEDKEIEPTGQSTYQCAEPGCVAGNFSHKADLLRHQRIHKERPHKCPKCDQSFLYPKDLRRHKATHLDDEDDDKVLYHCEVPCCAYGPGGTGISRKDGLTRHMKRFHGGLVNQSEEV